MTGFDSLYGSIGETAAQSSAPTKSAIHILPPMKFAYTILYVPDVVRAIEFHDRAFVVQPSFSTGAILDLVVLSKRAILSSKA